MASTCLVTIHGIGFQQPPTGGQPGYADQLHQNLAAVLPTLRGDPNRASGPVYVESEWPSAADAMPSTEAGLRRLGSWESPGRLAPNPPPLLAGSGQAGVAHVALVYSHLEFAGPQPWATLEAATEAALNLTHYRPPGALAQSLLLDVEALLRHPLEQKPAPVSLRPRTDLAPAGQAPPPSGIVGTIRRVEEDVAAYANRNWLRERVRDFVAEALLRLTARREFQRIVVNSHSQGTVVSFDVLRGLPDTTAQPVEWHLVTAGSPLRKYRDLFAWGDEVADIHSLASWTNYYDVSDPVADPLGFPNPVEVTTSSVPTLFHWTDPESGHQAEQRVDDVRVDNLANCAHPGGLQAHNYWDNVPQFVTPLAAILAGSAAPAQVAPGGPGAS